MCTTNRRDFIKNSSLLSMGVSLGFLPNILSPKAFSSADLKENWAHFSKKMGGQNVSILQDKSIFKSEKHMADFSQFRFVWGEPVHFKNSNVVARPLWKYWENATTPQDVTVLFWEKQGNWQYITALNSLELKTIAQLSDDFTEGVLMPRLGKSKLNIMEHYTAEGKMQLKAIQNKKEVVTQVKIWQNDQCIADKKIKIVNFSNLI